MKHIVFTIILIFNVLHGYTQNIKQQAYSFRLSLRMRINEKWTWHNETEYRSFTNPNRPWQSLSQSHVHYRFHEKWETVLGLAYAAVWQGDLVVPEWRPYQDVQYFQPLNEGWQLSCRARFEERFTHRASTTELTEGFGFRFRPRMRVQLSKDFQTDWTARVSQELLFHAGDGFNQSQTWFSIEKQFKHEVSLDLGYLKMFSKRATGGFFNRNMLRLSLIKNFNT
jgi:Protein of unknown function (DUF2490)